MSRFLLCGVLSLLLALVGCAGDGEPRQSPTGATTPTVPITSGPAAPCTATIVLTNGTTLTVSGSAGSTVSAGNVVINFTQTCDFSTAPVAAAEGRQ